MKFVIMNKLNQKKLMEIEVSILKVSIDYYIALPITDADRSQNFICRIIDIDYYKSLYELIYEAGVLNTFCDKKFRSS